MKASSTTVANSVDIPSFLAFVNSPLLRVVPYCQSNEENARDISRNRLPIFPEMFVLLERASRMDLRCEKHLRHLLYLQ